MSIETIAIVHHVHTDFGYTDHPVRAKREHIKYIDQAAAYVLASAGYPEGARFAWTEEQVYPVRQWWEQASDQAKDRFFEALKTGRLEIAGSPFNVTAFMDRAEWEAAMTWLDEDLWNKCDITSMMQIDVNGMHTAGLEMAYDKGVRRLWIGPNSYYGAPPFPTPTAFRWEVAPGKELFVWLNSSYNNGTFLFNENWRQGPVPNYSDLRYRAPEAGDIFCSSEEAILAAHKLCLQNVALIEGTAALDDVPETDGFTKNRVFGGYALKTLPVSVTSQWRVDNDPPFYPLVDFVRKWNEMGLKPRLILATARQAMELVEQELGENIPHYTGQWVDWWANGNASAPMEFSYNREAKRTLRTAKSQLFGPMSAEQQKDAREVIENICMYDEHTFGSWQSVSNPYAYAPRAQSAEKNAYAYRALDGAQCLLADRVRPLVAQVRNQIVVWNTTSRPMQARIDLPLNCMRGDYHSVHCQETGEVYPIIYTDGVANFLRPSDPSEFGPENVSHTFSDKCEKQAIVFGPVELPAMGCVHLIPSVEQVDVPAAEPQVTVKTDDKGWPVEISFPGQSIPVVNGAFGDLVCVQADGFSPRWTFKDIFENDDAEARKALRPQHLIQTEASYGETVCRQAQGVLVYEQPVCHETLLYARRILTVNPVSRRVDLELRMDRKPDFAPQVLFLRFEAPANSGLPTISNAGCPFRPVEEQLPGSCMDFYAIDGWISYGSSWLLNCVDNALVTFGDTSVVARKTEMMGPENRLFVRLVDNLWDTNFVANPVGLMNFRFTAMADVPVEAAEETAVWMETEPVVAVKMGYGS